MPRLHLRFLQRIPRGRIVPVGFGQQCPPDLLREPGKRPGIMRIEALLEGTHQARAGVGPVILHGRELVEQAKHTLMGRRPVVLRGRPCVGCRVQLTPPVAARLGR